MVTTSPSEFLWAVGIEDTFIPHVRPGLRRLDEYELTQHYRFWHEDLRLAAEAGARGLRWGVPWYRVEPAPGRWDWRWVDEVLDYAVNRLGFTVILDLVHYGTPLWLDNSFLNGRYPERVATYAAAVAHRYRSIVRHYTPANEPVVGADRSGRRGEWPPYLTGDDGFVKVALAMARGMSTTAHAIRAEQPDAVLVQVEATHVYTPRPGLERDVSLADEMQFLCFDLATGRLSGAHPLLRFLEEHGVAEAEIAWFASNSTSFDVFGLNYYPWSNAVIGQHGDGRRYRRRGRSSGREIARVARRIRDRYGLPIMVTETSAPGPVARRERWMAETLEGLHELQAEGVSIVGYTWFPLFPMIDWAYRTGRRPLSAYTLHLGLYDGDFDANGVLRREPTPLVSRFRDYAGRSFGPSAFGRADARNSLATDEPSGSGRAHQAVQSDAGDVLSQ
jgi:beta-glucosidase